MMLLYCWVPIEQVQRASTIWKFERSLRTCLGPQAVFACPLNPLFSHSAREGMERNWGSHHWNASLCAADSLMTICKSLNSLSAQYDLCLCYAAYTVEPHYNEVLGTMKITLLYQVSHYIRVKKQRNTKGCDQQTDLVIRGFCYIRLICNEVPL